MDDTDNSSDAGVGANESSSPDAFKLQIEALKLQLEIEKLKFSRVLQDAAPARSETRGIGGYAKELRAVLAPMPANDTMIPAWFKNADASLSALRTPLEMQGALILPFLSDAMRTSVIGQSRVPVLCAVTPELAVSADLLLTPDDYESLCLALKESGCHPGNIEPVAQASTGEAARGVVGEETNKRINGVTSCEVNEDLKDQKGVDQSSEITEPEEVEPQSDYQGEMVSMAHMHATGDSLQCNILLYVRGTRCWDLAGKR
ncbi:hypothetical protein MTO96_005748 [Rhipicephalus appendiculatus]